MRKILIGILIGVMFGSVAVVLAGNLNSPGAPTDAASESYSLEDIYKRLNDGTAGTQTAFTEPGSGPGSTGHTLNEIMAKAPAKDNNDGAGVADVAKDKKFWGLTNGAWGMQTGTASGGNTYNAGVPKTGQIKCFSADGTEIACANSGQDGELQKGVTWSSPRFTNNGDGTIKDNLTGLIWLKNANCFGLKNWATALTDANSLSDSGCDLTDSSSAGDWRLPNVRELYSLIHHGQIKSSTWLTNQGFTDVKSNEYWSSTSLGTNSPHAWYVSLSVGRVQTANRTNTFYLWPVRGGK